MEGAPISTPMKLLLSYKLDTHEQCESPAKIIFACELLIIL